MAFRFLLLVFVLGLAGAVWYYFSEKSPGPFESKLVSIPAEIIDAMEIQSSGSFSKLLIKKTENIWVGSIGTSSFPLRPEVVDSLLIPVSEIRADGIIEVSPLASWQPKRYRVSYFSSGKLLESFDIILDESAEKERSLFSFPDRKEVYKLENHIWPFFDRDVEAYRFFELARFTAADVSEVGISLEPYRIYSFEKDSNIWVSNKLPTDWVGKWLEAISNIDGSKHADHFDPIAGSADLNCAIDIRLETESEPVQFFVYRDTNGLAEFVVNCSQFPNHYFRSDSSGLYELLVPAILREEILTPE